MCQPTYSPILPWHIPYLVGSTLSRLHVCCLVKLQIFFPTESKDIVRFFLCVFVCVCVCFFFVVFFLFFVFLSHCESQDIFFFR